MRNAKKPPLSSAESLRRLQKRILLEFQRQVDEERNERSIEEGIKELLKTYALGCATIRAEESDARLFFQLVEPILSPLYDLQRRRQLEKWEVEHRERLAFFESIARSRIITDKKIEEMNLAAEDTKKTVSTFVARFPRYERHKCERRPSLPIEARRRSAQPTRHNVAPMPTLFHEADKPAKELPVVYLTEMQNNTPRHGNS